MPDIFHRVGIASPIQKVFEGISSIDGLRHWWVSDTKGNSELNETILFGFTDMKVVELLPYESIKWRCIRGPEEWLDTEVKFKLEYKENQTFVIFTHANWKNPVEFMHHCSTKWATFLLSLKYWLERDEGRPAPYDVKIHIGD
ncbi:hypothetical protein LEP1GSC047_3777 [Leptospira inadai serovar Lyme str. 10]|uniref:Activator of Hsp90 ATPase homologue 1/2-like C-terminal domain-containing protein n=2 Tax=Leptospira inadai serovar Lyme TaxID=293084 RepID=V6HKI8_9LEPT|nr:SRPBCC domain-containing protein [Leptospira inadai]EQA37405.1 hypothetical protein LEP1GSC047_3777 [Leptospira inadai serovar Lyme str. 10]PNV76236.1 SRPBCC domain-containing protein [Leptospira inadai serovar Lyme]